MVLGQQYIIEAFTPQCPDYPFAERIRLRAPHWRCDDYKVEVRERLIQSGGEDGVMVVDDEPVGMVRWYSFAQLLFSRSWLPREINRVPSRRQSDAPLR